MPAFASKQIQQWEAVGHAPLKPNEYYGRVRISFFQFLPSRDALPGGVIAAADTVRLANLPAGARLIGGTFTFGAFGVGATVDFGLRAADGSGFLNKANTIPDDPDAIATDVAIAAASTVAAPLFEELPYLYYETEKELELTAVFEAADPADNVELKGFILFVVD